MQESKLFGHMTSPDALAVSPVKLFVTGDELIRILNMAVFHKDPCGLICLFFTYSAVLYADYCFVQHVVRPTLTER